MTARDIAMKTVGYDAEPREVRLLACKMTGNGRMQQRWVGGLGSIWLDIPRVEVDEIHPALAPEKA